MNNFSVVQHICNAIVNTFYPDSSSIKVLFFNEGIDPDGEATQKDVKLFRIALRLVIGYVEGNRSENGISFSAREEAIKKSIEYWCEYYGLDAQEELSYFVRTIKDGTHIW